MAKVNIKFKDDIQNLGGVDLTACYNCGQCTAICPLSDKDNSFPREMVRYSVLGLEDDIKQSLKPWLCYYCGECSQYCPRQAFPGELMMSLRRWLTTKYDWTGLSSIYYRFPAAIIAAFVLLGVAVLLFAYYMHYNVQKIMEYGHLFEMVAVLSVAGVILIPNLLRMWYFTIVKNGYKVKLKEYFKRLDELFVHMFTQKRAKECEDNFSRWILHLILVIGYLSLLLTTILLKWLSTDNLFVIILGYVESAAIFIITAIFVYRRLKPTEEVAKHSHSTDWYFVIWLFMMGLTSFAVRLFVDLRIIDNNLWVYLLHLIILVQWALVIVPFGKWTHFLYRSFAMYYLALQENAEKRA